MKFKPGDKVIVRAPDIDGGGFAGPMRAFDGQTFEIRELGYKTVAGHHWYNLVGNLWCWHEDWLVPAMPDKQTVAQAKAVAPAAPKKWRFRDFRYSEEK